MASNGIVYRIDPNAMVFDQHAAVEIPYKAFLRLSSKNTHVGIDTLLSPNAISTGAGYSSRSIAVLHIPNLGMAWATRVCITLPLPVARQHAVEERQIGADFLFLWPPAKAFSAYLTVVEQTRLDNRARFLSTCDPTPERLFTDWNSAILAVATPVPPGELTVQQRIFAASFKPMVHLSSPRYTIDDYCSRRTKEEAFIHANAPIKLKYAGLKRTRKAKGETPSSSSSTIARNLALDFSTHANEPQGDEKASTVLHNFKGPFNREAEAEAARSPKRKPPTPITSTQGNTFWTTAVTDDVELCIVETVVYQALNTMHESDAIDAIRSVRLVSRAFCEITDNSVHAILTDTYKNAECFFAPDVGGRNLDGLLLKRSWWEQCSLPYMGLMCYRSKSPRSAVRTLASIFRNNDHKPYPRCSVLPTPDESNTKRKQTMEILEQKVEDLAVYKSAIKY